MANFPVPSNPVYNAANIRMLENTDPASATTTFNPLFTDILRNIHALKLSGGTVYQATIPASGWVAGAQNLDGSFWYQYNLADANVSAGNVIYMLPADGDSAVQVAEYLRGYFDTYNGGITLYAASIPDGNISVFYAINKEVV